MPARFSLPSGLFHHITDCFNQISEYLSVPVLVKPSAARIAVLTFSGATRFLDYVCIGAGLNQRPESERRHCTVLPRMDHVPDFSINDKGPENRKKPPPDSSENQ